MDEQVLNPSRVLEFSDVYETHFQEVRRWSRALGVPDSELEDVAQQVFMVVHRKLSRFDGRNLKGWLYRITARTASDFRRRSWFRNLFRNRSDTELDTLGGAASGPESQLVSHQDRQQVHAILAEMSEKRRVAFALFEIEGYSGEEIAELLDIPLGTVWTRLKAAREDFLKRVEATLGEEAR